MGMVRLYLQGGCSTWQSIKFAASGACHRSQVTGVALLGVLALKGGGGLLKV
jgi:hypothetical protein